MHRLSLFSTADYLKEKQSILLVLLESPDQKQNKELCDIVDDATIQAKLTESGITTVNVAHDDPQFVNFRKTYAMPPHVGMLFLRGTGEPLDFIAGIPTNAADLDQKINHILTKGEQKNSAGATAGKPDKHLGSCSVGHDESHTAKMLHDAIEELKTTTEDEEVAMFVQTMCDAVIESMDNEAESAPQEEAASCPRPEIEIHERDDTGKRQESAQLEPLPVSEQVSSNVDLATVPETPQSAADDEGRSKEDRPTIEMQADVAEPSASQTGNQSAPNGGENVGESAQSWHCLNALRTAAEGSLHLLPESAFYERDASQRLPEIDMASNDWAVSSEASFLTDLFRSLLLGPVEKPLELPVDSPAHKTEESSQASAQDDLKWHRLIEDFDAAIEGDQNMLCLASLGSAAPEAIDPLPSSSVSAEVSSPHIPDDWSLDTEAFMHPSQLPLSCLREGPIEVPASPKWRRKFVNVDVKEHKQSQRKRPPQLAHYRSKPRFSPTPSSNSVQGNICRDIVPFTAPPAGDKRSLLMWKAHSRMMRFCWRLWSPFTSIYEFVRHVLEALHGE